MNVTEAIGNEPREDIARLEERIEYLAVRLENCRKFALVARIAIGAGIVIFAVSLLGVIRFDIAAIVIAIAAVIGGVVLLGSNSTTANEVKAEIAEAEAARAAFIGTIRLRVVGGSSLLH